MSPASTLRRPSRPGRPSPSARAAIRVPSPGRPRVIYAVCGVLAVAAVAVCAVIGPRWLEQRSVDARRAEVLQQARQIGVNFTTLDYRTFDEDVQLVLDGATGEFRDAFRAGVEQTRELVTDNRSVSEGEVTEAALVSSDADSAVVLLVVDTEVTNTANPEATPRHYRMRLDLSRVGEQWLASDLQFVG